ncbi:MAG: hypothetical protein L0G87_13175 [Renibacterium salmoninarum]|nr:hypothetical protein [Renibacterium salmoninarum]
MSKNKTVHGIDPYAPGGLDELFAFHSATFGDAVMEAEGDSAAATADSASDQNPSEKQAEASESAKSDGEQAPATAEWDGEIESLPTEAQKLIRELRSKDADERIAAKKLAAIQKAINPDTTDAKVDPETLAADLAKERADSQTARETLQSTELQLAVFRKASRLGADGDSLLDSTSFLASIKGLDASDTEKIDAAIKDAVEKNPTKFAAARVAGKSSAEFNGGPGEQRTKPTTLDGAISEHYGS